MINANMLRGGIAIIRKAFCEFVREWVQIGWITVVEQIPDHFNLVFLARLEKWFHRTEVIFPCAHIYQRPANRLARGENADVMEELVVRASVFVVMRCGDLVDPVTDVVVTGRAFVSGDKENK